MNIQRLFKFCFRPMVSRHGWIAMELRPIFLQHKRNNSGHKEHFAKMFGNREMVGMGWNGQPGYADLSQFPFPSIRYKENTPEIMALREKEKGDWRLLKLEEKKALYRSQFCQTFSEFQAPRTEWMAIVGWALIFVSISLWLYILMHYFVYDTPLPESFNPENKREQLKRMIHLRVNPVFGLTSNWDYEKNDWKKKGWFTPPNPFEEEEEVCEEP